MSSEGQNPTTGGSGTTGRYLVLLRSEDMAAGVKALTDTAGLKVTRTADILGGAAEPDRLSGSEAIVFDKLGVAVVDSPPDQVQVLGSADTDPNNPVLIVEPERFVYAIEDRPAAPGAGPTLRLPVEYLQGYRDAVNHMVDKVLMAGGMAAYAAGEEAELSDDDEFTWGLKATRVDRTWYTGRGVKVAVLDTGLDLQHPDFVGRTITSQSFIEGEEVQDANGHGTHCIGTACGPKRPQQLPRYGVATGADIFAGKVLSDGGRGSDSGILAGIEWALTNECDIISMSLGARVFPGQTFSRVFEAVAQRALAQGTLIIAAAGNESSRPFIIWPVGHPANCPSVLAVGALDPKLGIASFSCGGINPQGGQVDIAGPGVAVRSSWPGSDLYNTISGTSMATPHVAGIAALLAEANSQVRGGPLGWLLLQSSRRLELPSRDVGAGLVQAP